MFSQQVFRQTLLAGGLSDKASNSDGNLFVRMTGTPEDFWCLLTGHNYLSSLHFSHLVPFFLLFFSLSLSNLSHSVVLFLSLRHSLFFFPFPVIFSLFFHFWGFSLCLPFSNFLFSFPLPLRVNLSPSLFLVHSFSLTLLCPLSPSLSLVHSVSFALSCPLSPSLFFVHSFSLPCSLFLVCVFLFFFYSLFLSHSVFSLPFGFTVFLSF